MLALVLCLFAVAIILTVLTKEARDHQRQNEIKQNRHKTYIASLSQLNHELHAKKQAEIAEKAEGEG